MSHPTQNHLAAARFVKENAILIFGLGKRCPHAGSAQIPSQWNAFLPHLGNIDGQIGNAAYGAIYNSDDSGSYDYICGVAVTRFPAHPETFTRLRIPPQDYAVFEHRDHVSTVANTWKAIWEYGLADSGCQAADGPAFERYGSEFDGRTGQGGFEIWIPVKA